METFYNLIKLQKKKKRTQWLKARPFLRILKRYDSAGNSGFASWGLRNVFKGITTTSQQWDGRDSGEFS